jgi:hypothetical protein
MGRCQSVIQRQYQTKAAWSATSLRTLPQLVQVFAYHHSIDFVVELIDRRLNRTFDHQFDRYPDQ